MSDAVAYFAKGRAVLYIIFLLGLGVLMLVGDLMPPHAIEYLLGRGRHWLPVLPFVWGGGIFCLVLSVNLLGTMYFDRGRALWVEGDQLVYFRKWFMSISCRDIGSMKVGSYGLAKNPGIILELKTGRQKIIPTSVLSESTEVVFARLKSKIATADTRK